MKKIEAAFLKFNKYSLYEETQLKLGILSDYFKGEEEFARILQEVLLVAQQEEKALSNEQEFFNLFDRVVREIEDDEEYEFLNSKL